MTYIAEKAAKKYGKVALMPVAVNYCFLRDNRPEILIEFGDIIHLTKEDKIDRREYTHQMSKILEELCDRQIEDIHHGKLKGYEVLFQTKLRWYRRIEQRLKKIDAKKSTR